MMILNKTADMSNNKKFVEILWAEKYNKFDKSEKNPIEKPNLPFQVVVAAIGYSIAEVVQKNISLSFSFQDSFNHKIEEFFVETYMIKFQNLEKN